MRDKLAVDVHRLLKIPVVVERDDDAERHVNDADDNGHLHFERVKKYDLVDGDLPDGINAEGVRIAGVAIGAIFRCWVYHEYIAALAVVVDTPGLNPI